METLPIINKAYELYKALFDSIARLERRHRYGLGQNLEQTLLDLLANLVMAKNAPRPLKASYLLRASGLLEILTLKLRLCFELKIINQTKVFQMQAQCAEIGRMLGGWLKSLS